MTERCGLAWTFNAWLLDRTDICQDEHFLSSISSEASCHLYLPTSSIILSLKVSTLALLSCGIGSRFYACYYFSIEEMLLPLSRLA